MPYCRHCHQEISKFDTDICPKCGGSKPIAEGYQTMDITRAIDVVEGAHYDMPKSRSQKTFAILCMTLGYLGIHDFYIYRNIRGVACILISLVFVSAVGFPLYFLQLVPNALAFLLPFAFEWIIFVLVGILYLKVEAPKDGHGDFLR